MGGSRDVTRIKEARPLFVIGAPRSGTTFVARLLNAHPRVLMTNETAVFLLLDDIVKKARKGVASGILYGKDYHELLADLVQERSGSFIEDYYERIAQCAGKSELSYWGEKHPHLSQCLKFVTSLYPNALYVHVMRDPRDSACSIARMNSAPFLRALTNWKRFADLYEGFMKSLAPARCHRIRYEALVEDYRGEARRLFHWLGLEVSPEVDEFLGRYSHVDAHRMGALVKPEVDFRRTSVGRWKREVAPEDLPEVERLVGDYLEKYGYERA